MPNKLYKKGLVVGIIVLFVGISIMPLVGSITINRYVSKTHPLGLDLSCNEPYKNVKQGDTATFIVEITNIGTIDDTYDVIAGSIEDIICKVNGVNADQFNPYEITLISGESTTFEVTAEVWESVPTSEWSIFVEACSQNDTQLSDELTLTANVQKKNKVISDSEKDCLDCQSNGKTHLAEKLLTRLERNEVLSNVIDSDNLWDDDRPICELLLKWGVYFNDLGWYYFYSGHYFMGKIYLGISLYFYEVGVLLFCWSFVP